MRVRIGSFLPLKFLLLISLLPWAGAGRAWAAEQPQKRFNLLLQLESSSSLHYWGDAHHSAGTDLWIWPQYKLGKHLNLSALAVISKELTGERLVKVRATDLILRRNSFTLSQVFKLSPALTLTPPLVTDRQSRESLIVAAKFAPRFLFDLSPYRLQGLSGFVELSGTRQFHEYFTASTGRVNTRYSVNLWLNTAYAVTDRLSISVSGMRMSAWSYYGRITNSFKFAEEISYELSPAVSISLSHENGGPLLRPNGAESNFALLNAESSTVYGAIALRI